MFVFGHCYSHYDIYLENAVSSCEDSSYTGTFTKKRKKRTPRQLLKRANLTKNVSTKLHFKRARKVLQALGYRHEDIAIPIKGRGCRSLGSQPIPPFSPVR